jgi:polyhydroxybutyrate depolymerase
MTTAILFLLFTLFGSLAPAQDEAAVKQESMHIDGVDRIWRLYVPPSYSKATATPLVLDFHGTGSAPEFEAALTGFEKLAAEKGFLVVSPAAKYARKQDGRLTWNVDLDPDGVDDVRFVRLMIERISAEYSVDQARIYATGMSGGARMSSRLACDLSDLIAAIGPVAGVRFPEDCSPGRPVPVIAFHGKLDPVNHYQHQSNSPSYWRMGVEEAVGGWVRNNQCVELPVEDVITPAVTRLAYKECKDDADVVFYRSQDAGHTWPGSLSAGSLAQMGLGKTNAEVPATGLIWEFFGHHSLRQK